MDEAPRSTVGRASLLSLAFGVFFFDYDLDGYPDIFAANGHIEEEIGRVQPKVQYKQPPLLFRNLGKRQVRERRAAPWAPQFSAADRRRAARPTPTIDHDGDLDVLITTNHGPAYLYRNDGGNRNNWICDPHRRASKSNRDGIGAVVRVESAVGQAVEHGAQRLELLLAERPGADLRPRRRTPRSSAIEIEWPSGQKDRIANVPANQFIVDRRRQGHRQLQTMRYRHESSRSVSLFLRPSRLLLLCRCPRKGRPAARVGQTHHGRIRTRSTCSCATGANRCRVRRMAD